jgi:hypothetical protein
MNAIKLGFLSPLIVFCLVFGQNCGAFGWDDSNGPSTATGNVIASADEQLDEPESETESMVRRVKDQFPDQAGLVKDIGKVIKKHNSTALITNDAIIFGILMAMLGLIFWTSSSSIPLFKKFYKIIPMLLVCYFLPSLLTFFHVVDHTTSSLYFMATRYLLPVTLVLLTLSIDLKGIIGLGPKALIMFLTGTVGVVLGGPIAV